MGDRVNRMVPRGAATSDDPRTLYKGVRNPSAAEMLREGYETIAMADQNGVYRYEDRETTYRDADLDPELTR